MVKELLDGVTSYVDSVRHVSRYGMWAWVFLPGLFSLLVGAGIFGLAYSLSDDVGGLLDNWWKWEWGRSVVVKVASVFGGLLVLLLGLLIFKQLIMVLASPFMSLLSEKVEQQLAGKKEAATLNFSQMLSAIARGLRIALRNLSRELLLTLALLVLGLVPVFTPFTTVLIFVIQSYYAGFGNLDFALERHFNYQDSVQFVRRHRGLAIGNGGVFILLLFTFAGFLVALPLGTVAATIETVKRLENPLRFRY